jgi:hypothetical protein
LFQGGDALVEVRGIDVVGRAEAGLVPDLLVE